MNNAGLSAEIKVLQGMKIVCYSALYLLWAGEAISVGESN